MSERGGVEIDYCPQCRGVWLDRGELDKIVERSAPQATQAQRPVPEYARHGGQGHSGFGHGTRQHKKPKHWLSEIFD